MAKRSFDDAMKLEICKNYESGFNLDVVASKYGIGNRKCSNILKEHGIELRSKGATRKYPLNQQAFSVVNGKLTKSQLYWIGFLLADGCLYHPNSHKGWVIRLNLAIKDYGHLVKFRNFLETTAPIHVRNASSNNGLSYSSASLRISSRKLFENLVMNGVTPNKSMREKLPNNLAMDYDVWRGIIDGDGSLYERTQRSSICRPFLSLIGSKILCKQFIEFVNYETGDFPSYHPHKACESIKDYGTVVVSGYTAKIMIHLLYDKAKVFLDRKMEIVKRMIKRGWKTKR